MQKGKLIVLEGLDGSGKATQTQLIIDDLKSKGAEVCKITFPSYDSPSSALVKMYLNAEFGSSPDAVNSYAASSFYAVDRYASYAKNWGKMYNSGAIIISDRYTTSNMVYQLSKLDKSKWDEYISWLEDYEYVKLGIPYPDLTIYLDMPVEVSQKFMTQRYNGQESKKDIHERNVEFLKNARNSALYAANKLGWVIISCSKGNEETPKSVDEIHNMVMESVKGAVC